MPSLRSVRPNLSWLEDRLAPALVAVGSEFLVNTTILDAQVPGDIAVAADGSFVVVWNSQDTGAYDVVGQRYGSDGSPIGGEFRVNTYTTGSQGGRAIAIDADGDFVIAWDSAGQDGSGFGVYARRYNAQGVPQGDEFRVNSYTSSDQIDPSIAMNAAGDFVVTWTLGGLVGSGASIHAQRFDAQGTPVGSEFQVNSSTTGGVATSKIAMDQDGDFVVVWTAGNLSIGPDGSTYGIYGQRFNAAGTPKGAEFRVNTHTTGAQWLPAVAMNASGSFVVAWTSGWYFGSANQDGDLAGIYAQAFHPDGSVDGGEFRVNSYTTGPQWFPAAAIDAAGNFVIAWESGHDGNGTGVFAQAYRSHGVPDGGEFRVNSFTSGNQSAAIMGMNGAGNLIIAWQSDEQDGDLGGVFAQRYGMTTAPQVTGVAINGGAAQRSRITTIDVSFDVQVTFAGAVAQAFSLTRNGGGAVSFTATANVVGGVTVVTLNAFTGTESESGSLSDGRYTLTVLANQVSNGGTPMASDFTFGDAQGLFRFYGDMNGDRRVDISDFGFFSLAFLNQANYNAALDFNNDGRIDIADFGQFSVRFFTALP